ncbi:MAG: hypothetical protein ACE5NG_12635, partial [bacterium]
AVELLVCFKDRLKNTYVTVGTNEVSEARRIARIWGEKEAGEPVTRTILKKEVSAPDRSPELINGIKVWPLPF